MQDRSSRDVRSRRWWVSLAAVLTLAGAGVFAVLQRGSGDEKEATEPNAEQSAAAEPGAPLRYDDEYPTIGYSTTRPTDPVAMLAARLEAGDAKLTYAQPRGYLDSLLAALEIDPASQVLVFSQTSLQARRIRPAAPRAIYFNDDVYVAWVQEGPIEIASMDPKLGAVYYLLEQTPAAAPKFAQEFTRCLSCHDSYSLSGGGVPRLIVGSGYTGAGGDLVTHEGWILVTDRTPLKSRWGGWYVTGQHGDQVHLGNVVIRSLTDFERLEELRIGNIETLDHLFDTTAYLTNKSDVVALMVLEHQTNVQNLITRVSYDVQTALAKDGGKSRGERDFGADLGVGGAARADAAIRRCDHAHGTAPRRSGIRRPVRAARGSRSFGPLAARPRHDRTNVPLPIELPHLFSIVRRAAGGGEAGRLPGG